MIFVEAKTSRLLIACTLGIGLVLLLLWPLKVWGQEGAGTPVNLDVILLIDNSWSMSREDPVTGAPPSDPEQLRIRAARFLVDYLRATAETVRANYRVGVVSFGGEVGDVIPMRLLQDDTVREAIRAEEIRLTDFRDPLQRALRELEAESFGAGNRMAVLLFTDGRPHLTAAPMTEEELRAYFEDLAPLVGDLQEEGASVFVLGIRDAQEDRDNWIQIVPQDRYFSVTSTEQLVGVCRHILADLTGAAVPEASAIPAGQAVIVDVQPYLERVLFSFMKSDPAIDVILISPTGAILAPTTGGTAEVHHAIYSIINPDPGRWKAFWEGEGEVRYWVERQYPLIRVEPARSSSPVDEPITITASLVRNNEPVADPDLQLGAEITLPGGDVVTQALSHVGGGRYSGSYEDVRAKGLYTVTGRAFLDDQRLLADSLSVTVDVFALPTVVTPTTRPTVALTQTPMTTPIPTPTTTPTPIGVADLVELLELGDAVVSPKRPRVGDPVRIHLPVKVRGDVSCVSAIAKVFDDTQVLTTTVLAPEKDGYGGELGQFSCPRWYQPACQYTILIIVQGELPEGHSLVRQRKTVVKVRWSRWRNVACALPILAAVGVMGWVVWRYKPRLVTIWGRLQWEGLRATQALVERLRRNRLTSSILPDERMQRCLERLDRLFAKIDRELLYAELHWKASHVDPLEMPQRLIEVEKELDMLRLLSEEQFRRRVHTAKTGSHIAGAQIACFEKWLDEGSSVAAKEWLQKLATSDLQQDRIAAGWCVAQMFEDRKFELYLDLLRQGRIPKEVHRYAAMIAEDVLS